MADLVATALEVRRDDLASTRIVTRPVDWSDGDVVLAVDSFALTANNLTYANLGDALGYWDFFPTDDPSWGVIPAWGYATVIASTDPHIDIGQRTYGFVPMASHVVIRPDRIRGGWFIDAAPHRATLARAYNAYRPISASASIAEAQLDVLRPVLAPVFLLSFLLDDSLAEHHDYAAAQVVITSASSKAAIGTGFLLLARHVPTVGVTSRTNIGFVDGLGIYQRVVDYDSVDRIDAVPTAIIDISGSERHLQAIRAALGESVRHEILAGFTHDSPAVLAEDYGRSRPGHYFSAPDRIVTRTRQWGRQDFDRRSEAALDRFCRWAAGWLEPVHARGGDVEAAFHRVRTGTSPPAQALLLSLL